MRQLIITKRITERNSQSINTYLSEVSKGELLKEEEEFELAKLSEKGDEKALNKLIEKNLRFVISVAKQYQHHGMPLEDLINDGNLGLIKAAKKFDSSRGFKFISYAVWWIRQSILQSLSENSRTIRIPTNQNVSLNKINRTISVLEQELEREPTDEEIQESLKGLDIGIKDLRAVITKPVSLDTPIKDGEDLCYIDLIPNHDSKRPDESFHYDSMQSDIEKVLNRLMPRQKRILCMYFGLLGHQTMTLEEIGQYFELTRERVRQIKDSSLRVLKCRGNSKMLRQYFDVN
jgi:RNA polymerase primary sigma factor